VTTAHLREFSYPNVFYRGARSGLVHEYTMGSMVTALQMGETTGDVSYVEKLSPDGEVAETAMIHGTLTSGRHAGGVGAPLLPG